jgi:hypothetical protein
MKLSPPTNLIFVTSLFLALLALLGYFVPAVPYLQSYEYWIAILAYAVLAAGCVLRRV